MEMHSYFRITSDTESRVGEELNKNHILSILHAISEGSIDLFYNMGFISMQESGVADKQQGAITSVLP